MNNLDFEKFKEYVDITVESICSKIDDDEKDFLEMLIKTFNEKCESIDKAIEYIDNDLKSFIYRKEYKTLISILKGESNEEICN